MLLRHFTRCRGGRDRKKKEGEMGRGRKGTQSVRTSLGLPINMFGFCTEQDIFTGNAAMV